MYHHGIQLISIKDPFFISRYLLQYVKKSAPPEEVKRGGGGGGGEEEEVGGGGGIQAQLLMQLKDFEKILIPAGSLVAMIFTYHFFVEQHDVYYIEENLT
jgi:hypothetical protein